MADVARANVAALVRGRDVTGAFNVASGTPRSIADLAQELWKVVATGGPPPVVTGEWRLGDVRHVVASPARATEQLGFRAAVPFTRRAQRTGAGPVSGPVVRRIAAGLAAFVAALMLLAGFELSGAAANGAEAPWPMALHDN